MAFHEEEETTNVDVENTNADTVQDVMAEVEETVEVEESIPEPVSLDESLEADEEENDTVVEVGASTQAIVKEEEQKVPEVRKETSIKPVVAKKHKPSAQEKSISKLQDQLNRHFDQSKKIEDTLKQIERKMAQIDRNVMASNKQHEIIRKMQVQFNGIQRTLTKVDKSTSSLKSRPIPKSKPSVKVNKKSKTKSKNLKGKVSRKK